MSTPSDLNIDHVAHLARLALTPEEKAQFAGQLSDVLAYVAQLRELDVTDVEPSAHAFAVYNVWAEDEPRAGLTAEAALRNAPVQRDQMFVVPKVVE